MGQVLTASRCGGNENHEACETRHIGPAPRKRFVSRPPSLGPLPPPEPSGPPEHGRDSAATTRPGLFLASLPHSAPRLPALRPPFLVAFDCREPAGPLGRGVRPQAAAQARPGLAAAAAAAAGAAALRPRVPCASLEPPAFGDTDCWGSRGSRPMEAPQGLGPQVPVPPPPELAAPVPPPPELAAPVPPPPELAAPCPRAPTPRAGSALPPCPHSRSWVPKGA
ncbi:basic proline-rich protein-like [Antechinus flavipes]|uniref:basic proline-rich protein-like n=1 Tax=Antechinus flavipes TaxID=38775 RepID=UPI0022363B29|nr:basic proline-rich protein-like [Antechinus flavipes]